MIPKELHLRIQAVIDHFSKGSQTAFAHRVGISQSTLNRNLRDKDDKLLMAIVAWVLLALPELSCQWLLTGEGEMLSEDGIKDAGKNTAQNNAQTPPTAHAPPGAEFDACHASSYASMIEHLRYIIESQKHTLEIQARMLEMHSADPFKKVPAPGSTAVALSAQHHNE